MKKSSGKTRTISRWLVLICSAIAGAQAQPASCSDTTGLTNAAQVRALTQAEAARHLAVRLRGVVLGESEPEGRGFAIHDSTGGIYLEAAPATVAALHPGDWVEAEGVSDPGTFAPFVVAQHVRKLGRADVPEPRRVTFEEMGAGNLDAQWVEVAGIVRFCEPSPNDRRKCRIELATGGGRLVVRWNVPNVQTPLVDAEVRLRGVCYYLVNRNRQFLSPMLAVPRGVPVVVEKPPPADPFAAPLRSASSLMQFAQEGSYGHRVHVRGVVTRQQPGEGLWIRDGERGLRAQILQTEALQPGDEVDVLGFPKQGEYSPLLEDATFRKRASGCALSAVRLPTPDAAFDHDADLVELDAVLTERQPVAGGWAFSLEAQEEMEFKALLRTPNGQPAPAHARPGSGVRVTGVCSVFREYTGFVSGLSRPRGFQLLLRSSADLAVLQPPPWWTRQRILWLLAAVAGVSVLAVGGVVFAARLRLREQAARRASAEAEFSAILAERNRVAREIHDILAQGLSAIVLHLDLAKDEFKRLPERVAKHLELAHRVARDSMADARNAVWNMRSQVLESGDLASALGGVLKHLTDGTSVAARFELAGPSRRLPPVVENALLRIGQEAITNATKHARPQRIEVKLEFADRQVTLCVRDDGCGFDASQASPPGDGFGLVGMRERTAQLGGELTIQSAIGEGTQVTLTVPVAA